MLRQHNIRYLLPHRRQRHHGHHPSGRDYCRNKGYELTGVGVPKTVDNDLFGTDHTPGFGSRPATWPCRSSRRACSPATCGYVDQFVVFQTVGRSAGWLPAAAALAKRCRRRRPAHHPAAGAALRPRPLPGRRKRCYDRYGWCSIVCGEGVCYADGRPISASQVTDKFANVEFGAMGGTSAAMMLHRMIHAAFGWRGEFQVCESLQMCAADRVEPDRRGRGLRLRPPRRGTGRRRHSGVMVSIVRQSSDPYRWSLGTAPLAEVAMRAKPMPDEYINAEGNFVTPACLEYLRPLVGPLPEYVRLGDLPV